MNDNVSIVQVSMHNAAVFKGSNFLLEGACFFLKVGVDSFNFNLKSIDKTDVKRESYHQQHHTFTGFTYDYTKASRGQTDYDIQMTEKLTVNTDYLTEDESIWMEDLFTSPVLYREVNNELIAMNITGKSIQKKTSLNDKLMQYKFELNYSLTNRRQRG